MHLYGPIAARRHDAHLLRESELMQQLKNVFPAQRDDEAANNQQINYCIYGDPAYPDSQWIMGGFANPETPYEKTFNKEMSAVRMVVEWGFKEIVNQFRFLDFRSQMKIYLSPVGAYYVVGIFFLNIRSCFYGNQTSQYFGCNTMTINEYLNLIDVENIDIEQYILRYNYDDEDEDNVEN
jgi:hypothetical protein